VVLDETITCGDTNNKDAHQCPTNYTCAHHPYNPLTDSVSFDNLPEAIITSFQISTLEG
jgi:hypothetical protein